MSREKRASEARRWLAQAHDDLAAASVLLAAGHRALAAFHAQQAAEKAIKAVWRAADLDPWGHSVYLLVRDLPPTVPFDGVPLLGRASALDKLYIPTRYPDALPDLTPAEAYTEEEGRRAIEDATVLLAAVDAHLGG